MFQNLIESSSHASDLKRRGSFILGTMALYALLLLGVGVASIFAYEARLDRQGLELIGLTVTMLPHEIKKTPENNPPVERTQRPKLSGGNGAPNQKITVPEQVSSDPAKAPAQANTSGGQVPPVLGAEIGPLNIPRGDSGNKPWFVNGGQNEPAGDKDSKATAVAIEEPPLMPPAEKRPVKPPVVRSGGAISGKILQKVVPLYPEIAKRARVAGAVTVEVLVDETGRVVSAQATSGHPLLQPAAVQAAFKTRFTPTTLSNQPVKVSGLLTFNFVLN